MASCVRIISLAGDRTVVWYFDYGKPAITINGGWKNCWSGSGEWKRPSITFREKINLTKDYVCHTVQRVLKFYRTYLCASIASFYSYLKNTLYRESGNVKVICEIKSFITSLCIFVLLLLSANSKVQSFYDFCSNVLQNSKSTYEKI